MLEVTIGKRETLQRPGVQLVAVIRDSEATNWWIAHMEQGLGQRLGKRIRRREQAVLIHGIKPEIHCVPRHSTIPGNEEADTRRK